MITQEVWEARAACLKMEWMGPVGSAATKTRARCLACGHEWPALPASVARGSGCPECGRWKRHRVAHDTWRERLRERGLEPLETVAHSARPVRARCLAAGHLVEVWPSGSGGCRLCRDEGRRLRQDEWDALLAATGARWQEPVRGVHTPTRIRCRRCGRERVVIPQRLREAAGMSVCACRDHTAAARAVTQEATAWTPAPVGADEDARIAALHALRILDTGPEPQFDEVASLVADVCEAPMAFVSLVDADREFYKSRVGWHRRQGPRDSSFCGHGIHADGLFVVPDAAADPRFRANPAVVTGPRIRFYAGARLVGPGGHAVGMLCVKDTRPRQLRGVQARALAVLGDQVSAQLELRHLRDGA